MANLTQRAPADLSQSQAEAESFSPQDTQDAPKDRRTTPGPMYVLACNLTGVSRSFQTQFSPSFHCFNPSSTSPCPEGKS